MVGTLNQSKTGKGVHTQGMRGGCMCNACMGGAQARHAWGVHTQGTCGGAHARHAWGCMHKVHMGGACAMHAWGSHSN